VLITLRRLHSRQLYGSTGAVEGGEMLRRCLHEMTAPNEGRGHDRTLRPARTGFAIGGDGAAIVSEVSADSMSVR
jgi:hypothetical protein